MERKLLNFPAYMVASVGDIGRLQTLSKLRVLPGDGFSLNLVGSLQLAPLIRGLTFDPVVDFFVFYVPDRHIYSNWMDFIEQGTDTTEVLASRALTQAYSRHGTYQPIGSYPLWALDGYHRVWNEYFRPPTTVAERDHTYPDTPNEALFGWSIAHLEEPWNTGVTGQITASDYEVASVNEVSLYDLAEAKGKLRTETEREFFDVRYRDIIARMRGKVNPDADQRPTLVAHETTVATGYDVDGTDTGALGQFTGRTKQPFQFRVPRWFVPEHGTMWVMCAVRFPAFHQNVRDYLELKPSPSYDEFVADPDVTAAMAPVEMTTADWFYNGGATSVNKLPYGIWHNWKSPDIHLQYNFVSGFPWMEITPANNTDVHLINPFEYDNMFGTNSLRHWNLQAQSNVGLARWTADPIDSVYAGTR